jgi:hypothetical protein
MRLEEVLPALRAGKKIRRKAWAKLWYTLKVGLDETSSHCFFVEDAIEEDWEVVREEGIGDKTMNDKKYCRLRHTVTNDEAQVVEDWRDGVHMIRHFYAEAKNGLFNEVTIQTCKDEKNFGLMWDDTIKAYQMRGWEVVS